MTTITTRAGKGSPLTNTELDNNFTNLNTAKLELSGGTMTGNLTTAGVISVIRTAGYGAVEVGGPSGGLLDLKSPASDDYDARIIYTGGDDLQINTLSASEPILLRQGNLTKLATTSTGVDITGTLTSDGLTVSGIGTFTNNTAAEAGLLVSGATSTGWGLEIATHNSGTASDLVLNGNAVVGHGTSVSYTIPTAGYYRWLAGATSNTGGTAGTSEIMRLTSAGNVEVAGNISVTGTVDGRDVSVDGTKLDGIEAGATADQTFDQLLNKTSATGEYSTTGYLQAGRGSGGVALTHNDGYGNANLTFNHKQGIPEQTGTAARIEVNTDSTSAAYMAFRIGQGTAGIAAHVPSVMVLNETSLALTGDLTLSGTLTGPTLRLTATGDASVTSTTHALQIGPTSSENIILDSNEIMARNNGALSDLNLNPDGGDVLIHNNTTAGIFRIGGDNVYHDGYHPNANTLTTARNINGVPFNGSENITVADATKLPLSGGTMTGNIVISTVAPSVVLKDTTAGAHDFWLHANSNNFYVLADRGDDGSYEAPHPLQLEADTNKGYVFGSEILTVAGGTVTGTLSTRSLTANDDLYLAKAVQANIQFKPDGLSHTSFFARHSDTHFGIYDIVNGRTWLRHIKNASAGSQQLRLLENGGQLGIGATPGGYLGSGNTIALGDSDTGLKQNGAGILETYANNVRVMRQTSTATIIGAADTTVQMGGAGDTFIANNTATQGFSMTASGRCGFLASDASALNVGRYTGEGNIAQFYYNGGLEGSISITASATTYHTTSDYRLKENITPIQGASDIVMAMRPCTYTAKADGVWYDGFLAHELQEVHPRGVIGTKDAMMDEEYEVTPAVYEDVVTPAVEAVAATHDDEGIELTPAVEATPETTESVLVTEAVMGTRSVPDMQMVDYSTLTPILTAALQEALTKIDALEVRLAALESA